MGEATPKGKLGIFSYCFFSYIVAYMCRLNLSSALLKMGEGLGVSAVELGLAGSLFFISYAVGKLVNGIIGDRVSPYYFIALALFLSALCNLGVAMCSDLWPILLCWTINGYVQSIIWSSIIRILSFYFSGPEIANVASALHMSMILGFVISWVVFGRMFFSSPWQIYFWAPAVPALVFAVGWLLLGRRLPVPVAEGAQAPKSMRQFFKILMDERLSLMAAVCVALGFIKESLSFWAPSLVALLFAADNFLPLFILPAANFVGVLLSRMLLAKFPDRADLAIRLMFICTAVFSLLPAAVGMPAPLMLLFIAAVSAMMNGCSTILFAYIPLRYRHLGIVTTLAGFLDFLSYMGASASSVFLGSFFTAGSAGGLRGIFWCWAVGAGLSVLLLMLPQKRAVQSDRF